MTARAISQSEKHSARFCPQRLRVNFNLVRRLKWSGCVYASRLCPFHDLISLLFFIFRQASWVLQRLKIHSYVPFLRSFVSSSSRPSPPNALLVCSFLNLCKVGPVDKLPVVQGPDSDPARYTGQFIAAGFSGHGMPRAFGWYVGHLFGTGSNRTLTPSSAEALAQMILAELTGREWSQPEWLPTRYLTWVERETVLPN